MFETGHAVRHGLASSHRVRGTLVGGGAAPELSQPQYRALGPQSHFEEETTHLLPFKGRPGAGHTQKQHRDQGGVVSCAPVHKKGFFQRNLLSAAVCSQFPAFFSTQLAVCCENDGGRKIRGSEKWGGGRGGRTKAQKMCTARTACAQSPQKLNGQWIKRPIFCVLSSARMGFGD